MFFSNNIVTKLSAKSAIFNQKLGQKGKSDNHLTVAFSLYSL